MRDVFDGGGVLIGEIKANITRFARNERVNIGIGTEKMKLLVIRKDPFLDYQVSRSMKWGRFICDSFMIVWLIFIKKSHPYCKEISIGLEDNICYPFCGSITGKVLLTALGSSKIKSIF